MDSYIHLVGIKEVSSGTKPGFFHLWLCNHSKTMSMTHLFSVGDTTVMRYLVKQQIRTFKANESGG